MVKNQTVLHPASVNLGKGDSRYVLQSVGSGILCVASTTVLFFLYTF